MVLSTDKNFMQILGIIVSVFFTSFYFFPFEFEFLPGINTKLVMAVIGLVSFGFNIARNKSGLLNKDFLNLSVIALLISFISYVTVVYNNTNDFSFVGYVISMWVWLGGAYAWILWIKMVHGDVTVRLVVNYLLAVCTFQCLMAYTMHVYPPLDAFVDSFLGGEAFMGRAEGRLYGIGCALDVAGLRFSAVLAMTTYVCLHDDEEGVRKYIGLYILGFLIVSVIGNMMARSTTIGLALSLLYCIYVFIFQRNNSLNFFVMRWFFSVLLIALPFVIYLYNTNVAFYLNLRFGFEGFFSLWEKGSWEVTSNDILLDHMIRFPETMRTWLIGDGYASMHVFDPYYMGPKWHGYYMATDIGYLRFIFYFGIFGALTFVLLMCEVTSICIKKISKYKVMFVLMLLVNLIGWVKVSSDIFVIFAPFLCLSMMKSQEVVEE